VLAATLCLVLLGVGVALTAVSGPAPLHQPVPPTVVALLLLAAYFVTARVSLDFEVRGDAHSVALGQLPLALGTLVAAPALHLAACLTATVLASLVRRQHLLKSAYNAGAAGFEVGASAFCISLVHADGHPSAWVWAVLYAALLGTEAVGHLALSLVWLLLGMPVTPRQVLPPLALGAATSTAAGAVALITVSAAYTEPASVVLVLAIAAALAFGYRRHRLLAARQATTEQLYAFVRDLGPVDPEQDAVQDAIEQVRLLLNAERLVLLLPCRDGSWQQVLCQEDALPQRLPALPPTRASHSRSSSTAGDVLTSTLLGAEGVLGVLTANGRLGDIRGFDLGDVRMLETVGAELATALERGRLLADLRRTATTDPLTGLPNLTETTRRLDEMLQENGGSVVLSIISVDTFRDVNETLGHGVGDELLLETARRLREAQPDALIGRIGGTRFAVAAPAEGEDVAVLFGLGLRTLVEGEARIGPVGTQIRLSVGVAQAPEHGTDGRTLLRRAETAMSSARTVHGGPVAWAPAYEVQGQRRLAVLAALREAVATGAIGLAFQPKVDARTGAATGVEALARWTHPALGTVTPEEFVPLAEASGFIGPLTSTVLRQATTAARGWQRRAPGVGVAVNVSADTVLDPMFVAEVSAALAASGLPPELLTLELTEGVVVSDPALAAERLGELRSRGVRIAVDDFGTGYSALSYLKGLPVDEVKIDKTFVQGVAENSADAAIVQGVIHIVHALGLRVVAEGVETAAQHEALVTLGVDEVQGYLHARPMATAGVAGWLRDRSATVT
jgi:diguanylate cyclase (GGDEF)-like protein